MKEPNPNDYILDKPEDNTLSLTDFLYQVKDELDEISSFTTWVTAETAKIKKNGSSGHVYLELIDRDNNGKEISKINAKIWSREASFIISKFETLTGEKLKDGIKCEWLVKLDYNIMYGLSLTLIDIKPLWSIGEHEKKINKIRDDLKKLKIYDLQKKIEQPKIYTSIAIIGPNEAAGLGDFLSEAKIWHKKGLIRISLFNATFEGEKTTSSILSCLEDINKKNNENQEKNGNDLYDLIIVLRGGGSKTSLSWLDDFNIAKKICETTVPVWTAIGHEQDFGILDEVSSYSLHTPSKAAQRITESLINELSVNTRYLDYIQNEKERRIEKLQIQINNMYENILSEAKFKINILENKINNLAAEASLLGPQSTLQRGYTIVKNDKGDILKNVVSEEQTIKIIWSDGEATAKIIGDKNDK